MARPREEETKARTREFLRLVSQGKSGREAAREAKIDRDRALDVLATLAFPKTKAA